MDHAVIKSLTHGRRVLQQSERTTHRLSPAERPTPSGPSGRRPIYQTLTKTTALEPVSWPDAVEVDRAVPASGNMTTGPQQFWLGTSRTGQTVRFWIVTTTVHLSIAGWRIKTVPSRLSAVDLARLRHNGAARQDRPRQETRPVSWPRPAAPKCSG